MNRFFHDPDRVEDIGFRGVGGGESAHDADKHNLAIIQADKRLQRILTAYRCMNDQQRESLERATLQRDNVVDSQPQHADMLQLQVAAWKSEIARLQDMVATAESQPAPQQDLCDGWALPDVIEALRASGFEVRGEDAAAIVYETVEAGAVLIDGAIEAFSRPDDELVAASVQQDRQDAERYRFRKQHLADGGVVLWVCENGCQYRIAGGELIGAGATEEEAIDAALAARKEPKP